MIGRRNVINSVHKWENNTIYVGNSKQVLQKHEVLVRSSEI